MVLFGPRYEASLRSYIGRPSGELNYELALVSFPMCSVEGHINHSSRVLRHSLPEQSSFCCLVLLVVQKTNKQTNKTKQNKAKKQACFYELRFGRTSSNISRWESVLDQKLQEKVLISARPTISFFCQLVHIVNKLRWSMNFDGLTFLTTLVLFNQSDYLSHCN